MLEQNLLIFAKLRELPSFTHGFQFDCNNECTIRKVKTGRYQLEVVQYISHL